MSVESWGAIRVTVPSSLADELCGLLAWDSIGAELDAAGSTADTQTLSVYLREPSDGSQALDRAGRVLRDHGLDPRECDLHFEPVADGRWVERYQALLRPFPIGAGYMIYPSGEIDEAPGERLAVRLVPGRAFGTGEHATTQLCTERLEEHVSPESTWLDVGCGTAILSLVARHRGAHSVLALDLDPQAIDVAREVLDVNRVEGVRLLVGQAHEAPVESFDGVVVNISAPFFEGAADVLAQRLVAGGILIASGFTIEQQDEVAAWLGEAGFEVSADPHHRGVWAALVATRQA